VSNQHTLAPGADQLVGRFRCDLATQQWWWSDETFQIHGFKPGDVVPTTALVLAHKHPDDRERVSHMLRTAGVTGEPFSSVHRIMDARGRERTLTVVGQGRRDPDTHQVRELVGYFVDVTPAVQAQASEAASAAIRASAASRATIEQAKGIIAFALNVDVEEAFERLRAASNDTNVAVRDIARQVVETASARKISAAGIADALAG
jgi:PAS domain-containing protein